MAHQPWKESLDFRYIQLRGSTSNPFRSSSFGLMDGNFGLLFKHTYLPAMNKTGLFKNKAKCDMCIKSVPWSFKSITISDFTLKWAVLKLQKIQTFKADYFMTVEEMALLQEFKRWIRFSSRFINLLWFTMRWSCLDQGDIKTGLARRFMASKSNSETSVSHLGNWRLADKR